MTELYIGLMSGTSLDGADAVLADFSCASSSTGIQVLAHAHAAFPGALRDELLALQQSGPDELHRGALASNALADHYAMLVTQLLEQSGCAATSVEAIGAHGQTVRHRPELAYTLQLNAPARLAELTGIDVIADLRSRDVAAGGHGAPLVPGFHAQMLRHSERHRVIVNIGGISNVADLPAAANALVRGWDCGPGNVLMDTWIKRQRRLDFDANGDWAASGQAIPALLQSLQSEAWLRLPPPKSTGRDLFNSDWLDAHLQALPSTQPENVQATLAEFTAWGIADAIARHAANVQEVIVSGGGAMNAELLKRLEQQLKSQLGRNLTVQTSAALGIPVDQVEAVAFAWLARQFTLGLSGNLASVTGAKGPRILGALYPGLR